MLSINDLKTLYENGLNTNAAGYVFKIFTDVGEFKNAYRVNNDIIENVYGIYRVFPSELVAIKNLKMSNITAQVEFAVDISKLGKDANGNFIEAQEIRNIVDGYAQTNNATSQTVTGSDGLSYNVTFKYTFSQASEVVMETSDFGEIMPITATIYYVIVENGINSNDLTLTIDGEEVFTTDLTISRVRTADQNSFAGETNTKTAVLQNGLGIDFVAPLLKTELSNTISDDIFSGSGNNVHCVSVDRPYIGSYIAEAQIANGVNANNFVFDTDFILNHLKRQGADNWFSFTITTADAKVFVLNCNVAETGGVTFPQIYFTYEGDNYYIIGETQYDDYINNAYCHYQTNEFIFENQVIRGVVSGLTQISQIVTNNVIVANAINEITSKRTNYMMIFGNNSASASLNLNVGANVSLAECVPHLANYNLQWTRSTQQSGTVEFSVPANTTIFWGDNKSNYYANAGVVRHIYEDAQTHTIYKFTPAGV